MWSIKKKTEELKNAPSINMVSCVDDFLACEDEGDYEVKRCETLNEWRIYCVKVDTQLSPTSSTVKKIWVEDYYKHRELVWFYSLQQF